MLKRFLDRKPALKLICMILPGLAAITVGRGCLLFSSNEAPWREDVGITFFVLGWLYLLALLAHLLLTREISRRKAQKI